MESPSSALKRPPVWRISTLQTEGPILEKVLVYKATLLYKEETLCKEDFFCIEKVLLGVEEALIYRGGLCCKELRPFAVLCRTASSRHGSFSSSRRPISRPSSTPKKLLREPPEKLLRKRSQEELLYCTRWGPPPDRSPFFCSAKRTLLLKGDEALFSVSRGLL